MSPKSGQDCRHFRAVAGRALTRFSVVKLRPFPTFLRAWPLALWLALPAPAALAQTAGAVPASALAEALALARDAAAAQAPAGARVQVQAGAPDPRWKLAPCERVSPQLAPGLPVWGRTRIGLRCSQGPVAWLVYLPISVQVFATVPTPRTALPAGTRLSEADLATASVEWSASAAPPMADIQELLGRVLVRPVLAGQALQASDLRRRQWFVNGETVKLVARGPGFSIAAEGQALGDGVEGQPVRVRVGSAEDRNAPARVVVGRATAERLVEVGP
jgi:flagella basal body P-ring formation protein FlgA